VLYQKRPSRSTNNRGKRGEPPSWISDERSVVRIAEALRRGVRRHASFVLDLKSPQRLRYFRLAPHRSRSAAAGVLGSIGGGWKDHRRPGAKALDCGAHLDFLCDGLDDLDNTVPRINLLAQTQQAELPELVYVSGDSSAITAQLFGERGNRKAFLFAWVRPTGGRIKS
jgi:hypothetical protein